MHKAGVIVTVAQDTVLLVQGRKSKKWGFPKGHQHEDETIFQTAQREMMEETGIEVFIHPNSPALVFTNPPDRFFFHVNVTHMKNPLQLLVLQPHDKKEIVDIRAFHLTELRCMKRRKITQDIWNYLHPTPQTRYICPKKK
jgi:8-oxo-dGTP pyrophosphatase MutT (NUDIX family)